MGNGTARRWWNNKRRKGAIMKPISEVYPEHYKKEQKGGSFYGPYDYGPLLESLGHEILLKVDDDDYQGDSRVLMKNGNKYGILIFGWGSCSGCDELQDCKTMKDIENLRTKIANDIKWNDSKWQTIHYIENKDWELEYCWHAEETQV